MLDDRLLEDFIQTFRGYGSFEAPWWFVGMEEGGGKDEEQIAKRLSAWASRGRRELEDLAEYHREFGMTKFWSRKPPTQPTWRKLIRLKLTATLKQAGPIALEQVREYQRDHWGRKNDQTCLLELLPLPSPRKDVWLYSDKRTKIPQLKDRKSYFEWLIQDRIRFIRERIEKHRPKVVVFYGFEYSAHWQEAAGTGLETNESAKCHLGHSKSTLFIVAKHPASERGNDYWDKLATLVRR